MKLFLVGFMGAGKTSIGKVLASHFQIPFFDQDSLLESVCHKTISEIFEASGEVEFRNYERDLLREFPFPESFVLATGGGCPCFHENMDWINRQGISIYLQAEAAVLTSRLQNELAARPLLSKAPMDTLEQEISLRLDQRKAFYEQARICLKMTASEKMEEIASRVICELQG